MADDRDRSALEAAAGDRRYWRALDELEEGYAPVLDEFPAGASAPDPAFTRRGFLGLAGASAALAACGRPPREPILPYVHSPPGIIPGEPLHFATSMALGGYAVGLVVESHTGRPIKVDGNPEHPASLGGTTPYQQGWVAQLYDPERARAVAHLGVPRDWSAFVRAFSPDRPRASEVGEGGRGLRFLLEPTSSPLLAHLIERVRSRYPAARFTFDVPFSRRRVWEGTRAAFGEVLEPQGQFSEATVVVSIDDDFLGSGPLSLRYAREFMLRRRPQPGRKEGNRLYVVEDSLTLTGTRAEHRLRLKPSQFPAFTQGLLGEVLRRTPRPLSEVPAEVRAVALTWRPLPEHRRFVEVLARDLWRHAGEALIVVGAQQPPEVQAMVHGLNELLGAPGRTVTYRPSPVLEAGGESHDLAGLVRDLDSNRVDTLIVLEGNPVYSAPVDLEIKAAMGRARERVHLSYYANETTEAATWSLPAAHGLESWGDGRAYDGTLTFSQPLLDPLFPAKTASEVLAVFLGEGHLSAHTLLRQLWQTQSGGTGFEDFWRSALERGFVPDTAYAPSARRVRWELLAPLLARLPSPGVRETGIEVSFRADLKVYDGRFTDNAWLLELPDPITKVSWDNVAELSPSTAKRLGIETESLVQLRTTHGALSVPVLVIPGHADDTITLSAGYGREGGAPVARGVGFSAFRLQQSDAPRHLENVEVTPLGQRYPLALTQTHWRMHGRPIVLDLSLAAYRALPDPLGERNDPPKHSLYSLPLVAEQQWGMAVDTTTCIGCHSCMIACQAENNIPLVGKAGVRKGREMYWLHVHRYFTGPIEDPQVLYQPMMCQHCEMAPCEYACPVNATVHSPDGLNEMVYNRCVGTRDCSTNCPYKVRRFNWFDYHHEESPLEQLKWNPDLSVRGRGVIEKCTYCVQRIRQAQMQARMEHRSLAPDEVKTACQEACPTDAIVFGDLSAKSRVHAMTQDKRAYGVLSERGTRPRTRYLATLWNPVDALAAPRDEEG